MKNPHRILIFSLALTVFAIAPTMSNGEAPATATEPDPVAGKMPRLIDDHKLKAGFEKGLGELMDEGKARPAKELVSELKERQGKTHPHRPAPATDTGAALEKGEIYRRSLESSLIFGNIYKCDKCNNWHGNVAGGFILSGDGLAITNFHVLDDRKAAAFGAMTADGRIFSVKEVLASSKPDDVALVQLEIGDAELTPIPVSPAALPGDEVTVVSHPRGLFFTLTEGVVSRYSVQQRPGSGRPIPSLEITADYAAGSSGSPVFDARGNVTGLVKSTRSLYYTEDKEGNQKNLQMVIKTCVPATSMLGLLSSPDDPKPETAASGR